MSKKQIPEDQIKRMEEISMFIKNWRIMEGMSQYEFSNLTDLHTNSIHNIERGKNITINTLFACIDGMDMSLQEFFEGME